MALSCVSAASTKLETDLRHPVVIDADQLKSASPIDFICRIAQRGDGFKGQE
jgi:hypothetical protein